MIGERAFECGITPKWLIQANPADIILLNHSDPIPTESELL
jgi:hypothetical protein